MPDLAFSVSFTTRPMREGEQDGREYHFVTRQEFERLIGEGEFLEYAEVHGNLYGTSSAESDKLCNAGKDVIVEVDVQGAIQIMEKPAVGNVSIFILPPSFDVLRKRLTARGTESDEQLDTRLRNAFDEVRQYPAFKYIVVNNDVTEATDQITSIIVAERQVLDRQTGTIQGILDSFDASKHLYTR